MAMTNGSSSGSFGRWLIPLLTLFALSLAGMWELLRGGAHRPHLLLLFLALLISGLAVLGIEFLSAQRSLADTRLSDQRLRNALLAGKSVVWDLDVKTGVDQWFGDLKTMFGISSESFTVQIGEFYRRVHPEDRKRVAEAVARAQAEHGPYASEFRVIHEDGSVRWVSASGEFQYSKKGDPVRMLGVAVDITQYRQLQDSLITSEAKFAKAFRSSPVAMTLTSAADNRYIEINETFEQATGWARDEVIGRTPFDINLWVDPDYRKDLVKQVLQQKNFRNVETRYRRKDGSEGMGLGSGELIEFGGEPCILAAMVDITDRKRAEEALHQKERDLAEAQRLGRIGSWECDADGSNMKWSEELYRIYGLDPTAPAPTVEKLRKLYTTETWDRMLQAMETKTFTDMDIEVVRPDGTARWIRTRFDINREPDGTIVKFRGISQDITEEKQIADHLRQSEERFRRVVDHIGDAVFVDDVKGRAVFANDQFLRLFGFRREQLPHIRLEDLVAPEHRTEILDRHNRRMRGEAVATNFEYQGIKAGGTRMWLEVDVVPILDHEGKITGTQSVLRDIAERKRGEMELRQSEERFRRVVEHIGDALIVDDVEGHVTFANDQFFKLFGFCRDEVEKISLEDYVAPDYRTQLRARHTQRMSNEELSSRYEFQGMRRDGTRVWIDAEVAVVMDHEGRIFGSHWLLRDIPEQKRGEMALRESEERFRLVANAAPVMIRMSGTDKLCNYFNGPWLDFTGGSLASEIGDGWFKGVHPEDASRCMQTYVESFDKRKTFEMQYRLRRHDGEFRWVLDLGTPRFNADGSFAGYIGSCIDVTERKQAEQALATIGRRLIEAHEEERTWIGRELHDDINQRLALLSVELDRWLKDNPSRAPIRELIHHAQERIAEIARDVQTLSHRLHSSKLEYLGLAKAINSFCRELSQRSNVEITFKDENVPRILPQEISLCLFRVLQEALQNAVKHSGVKAFTVSLHGSPDAIELAVEDNGSGFDPTEAFTHQGIGLISMRERLQLVQGELAVQSKPGSGTKIHARVPLQESAFQALAG